MTDNEMNTIKTDIVVIKRDIAQISQVYKKVDDTLEQISEIAKTLAVQEKTLENDARRIATLEENLMKHNQYEAEFRKELNKRLDDMIAKIELDCNSKHKQVLVAIEKMSSAANSKLAEQDKRITALEGWRWYVAGIVAVIVIIANKIPWTPFFGG
jgi:predicted RNase H-like nuclease (RuvC/YqgF family)